MFEHFGLKDVFCGLWKHKWKIVVFGFFMSVITTFIFMMFPIQKEKSPIELGESTELQSKETYFYFEYEGNDQGITSEVLAQLYSNTIKEQECLHYVADYVLTRKTKEDIVNYLNGNINESQITKNFFSQYVTVSVDTTDIGISVLVRTPNKEFTDVLGDAYMSWFQFLLDRQSHVKLIPVMENEDTIVIDNASTSTIAKDKNLSIRQVMLVSFCVFVMLGCIIIFFVILFKPVLNRKTDFEEIGIEVIGNITLSRREDK
ncbi:hypothetical protein DWX08_12790 [Ruminococcus sp. AF18-22]|nr:hypothetical protein DWX08_12790 [Ruminococcus sp. AF18-22]